MQIKAFVDEGTGTLTYVVWETTSKDAVIIDPILDFDARGFEVSDHSIEEIVAFVREEALHVHWILETHVHADHLSGQHRLKQLLGAKTAISHRICEVQHTFKALLDLDPMPTDGSQWDRLLYEGEPLLAGTLEIEPLETPGHTPACTTLKIQDALFTGDTLFMPDFGTGRCDFPGGCAADLYDSIQKLYALPPDTRVFVGHDYGAAGRDIAWETTIGTSRVHNKSCPADRARADFVSWRTSRDAGLSPPALLEQALTVNCNAGCISATSIHGPRPAKHPTGELS